MLIIHAYLKTTNSTCSTHKRPHQHTLCSKVSYKGFDLWQTRTQLNKTNETKIQKIKTKNKNTKRVREVHMPKIGMQSFVEFSHLHKNGWLFHRLTGFWSFLLLGLLWGAGSICGYEHKRLILFSINHLYSAQARSIEELNRLADGHSGCVLLTTVHSFGQHGDHRVKRQELSVLAWAILEFLGKEKCEVDFSRLLHVLEDEKLEDNDVPQAVHPWEEIYRKEAVANSKRHIIELLVLAIPIPKYPSRCNILPVVIQVIRKPLGHHCLLILFPFGLQVLHLQIIQLQTKFRYRHERLTPFRINCITLRVTTEYPGETLNVYEAKNSRLISSYTFGLHLSHTPHPTFEKYLWICLETPSSSILSLCRTYVGTISFFLKIMYFWWCWGRNSLLNLTVPW